MTPYLGRISRLPISRIEGRGALLEAPAGRGEPPLQIVLPLSELPPDARVNDRLEVFVYLDSEDRPVATTRSPAVVLGEVVFLKVVDSTQFGCFVDWGLPKDLLVPFKEQVRPMNVGERHAIALYVDDTGRLAGTTKVGELLEAGGDFALDEWVDGVVWRYEPEVGTFVILERHYLALLPPVEVHKLQPGDEAKFRVAFIQPDGKIEVSVRALAYQELEADAERLFEILSNPNAPRLGDRTDPAVVNELLGISKKAFKRAAGRLLKRGVVELDRDGYLIMRRESVGTRTAPPAGAGPKPGGSRGGAKPGGSRGAAKAGSTGGAGPKPVGAGPKPVGAGPKPGGSRGGAKPGATGGTGSKPRGGGAGPKPGTGRGGSGEGRSGPPRKS